MHECITISVINMLYTSITYVLISLLPVIIYSRCKYVMMDIS